MRRITFFILATIIAGISSAPTWANGKNLPIDAFFGVFKGGGVAEEPDNIYFGISPRDFDVVIRPKGKGFKIDWTTLIRVADDPANPKFRRRTTTKSLKPSGTPGVYHGMKSGNPLDGQELCWARIEKNTLSVFIMTVNEKGVFELQQYDRTLSGATPGVYRGEIKLLFRSWRDGDRVRSVSGRLIKTAN